MSTQVLSPMAEQETAVAPPRDTAQAIAGLMNDFSIEVTPRGATKIAQFQPLVGPGTRVYVTSLPGSDFNDTLAACKRLASEGLSPVPHFTARSIASAQELRERIDRMGPVNVLAVEQAQELEERHTFLTAQRQDLLDSIAELDRAIKGIDKASRERFQEAFAVINQHFGEIFRQLFGGGTAGLSLLDEDDILESGIDVMAQPPGKRLQSVMLLSGGEKALTAISLLFAIFKYKPSPFCILDEVDAPLDDANVGRFVRMLEGMKTETQFILITHHRKTMEIADQLYGVTMEEPGVSKLVSVRFS